MKDTRFNYVDFLQALGRLSPVERHALRDSLLAAFARFDAADQNASQPGPARTVGKTG